MNSVDLLGKKFGRLLVIDRARSNKHKQMQWLCKCDCGKELVVTTTHLKTGHTRSCGCLHNEGNNKKHGLTHTKVHGIWQGIKRRCFNANVKEFMNYGGRGITVCDEWNNDFQTFYDYVSQLPHFGEAGYSLDRINNNGNYEPGNVKWSTRTEQGNNKRNTILVEVDGETHTLTEWSEITGIKYSTLYHRYKTNKNLF